MPTMPRGKDCALAKTALAAKALPRQYADPNPRARQPIPRTLGPGKADDGDVSNRVDAGLGAPDEPHNGDEDDRSDECGDDRSDQSAGGDTKKTKQPATDQRAD